MRHLNKFVKPMEFNRTWAASVSQIFFDCYDISICKKGKVKDATSKKIRETYWGQNKEQDWPKITRSYERIHIT